VTGESSRIKLEERTAMLLNGFKKRVSDVRPGMIAYPEQQEVIIRIVRGGRKKDHYATVKYVCGGSLGLGDGKHYTEITFEYLGTAC